MASGERRLCWTLAAKDDVREIWRYYARIASRAVADKVLRELHAAAKRAVERPFLLRPRDDIAPGLRAVLVQPYILFYKVTEETVEIVRVLHQRRHLAAELRRTLSNKEDREDSA